MLGNLKELVAIDSCSNNDEIVNYLLKRFSSNSKEIKIIKNKENEKKSVVIGLNTNLKDVEPIVLSGHIDTVAPDLMKYETNPFELVVKDDKAYGLGSIDMKSFTAIILDNVDELKRRCYPHCYFINN